MFGDVCIWNIFLGTLGQGTAELEGGFICIRFGWAYDFFLSCWRPICKA